jgi:hypothetical protein
MSNVDRFVPSASYGLLDRTPEGSPVDQAAEQVRHLGYALLDAGYAPAELRGISDAFESVRKAYIETHGEARLRNLDEFYTVRSLLTQPAGKETFLALALNPNLMAVLKQLIQGKFILNQQNAIVNPPQEGYNQSAWHRDLPYQHFVSSRPLAINALFCVDDFTFDNGATFVLPASHKAEPFPSRAHVERNATQIEAKAGSFILLDCMMFHAGGFNKTTCCAPRCESRLQHSVFQAADQSAIEHRCGEPVCRGAGHPRVRLRGARVGGCLSLKPRIEKIMTSFVVGGP